MKACKVALSLLAELHCPWLGAVVRNSVTLCGQRYVKVTNQVLMVAASLSTCPTLSLSFFIIYFWYILSLASFWKTQCCFGSSCFFWVPTICSEWYLLLTISIRNFEFWKLSCFNCWICKSFCRIKHDEVSRVLNWHS